MIYTVGLREQYDSYIAKDREAAKAAGGTVWKTFADAEEYLKDNHYMGTFGIYGVEADWETDTELYMLPGVKWRTLKKDGRLHSLDKKVPGTAIPMRTMLQFEELVLEFAKQYPISGVFDVRKGLDQKTSG